MTTRIHRWPTFEAAADHLRRHNGGSPEWIDRVARIMFEGGHCVWHASHLDMLDGYETGRIADIACPHCGGRADPRIGFHHLCKARADRGMPTPMLDATPHCHCHTCAKARGER